MKINKCNIFNILLLLCFLTIINNVNSYDEDEFNYLSVIIKSTTRNIEVSWKNFQYRSGFILLTDFPPTENFKKIHKNLLNNNNESGVVTYNISEALETINGIIVDVSRETIYDEWTHGINNERILKEIKVENSNGWITTDIVYPQSYSKEINVTTNCYGFWITHINETGNIIKMNCLRAYPTWMNDLHENIENLRIRNIFIPGTHDSASYPTEFNPNENETIVTKYSITQDEDIRSQLMHGIRYLDIRVGYYKFLNTKFWANHGISRQQPLYIIFKQIRQFVMETNEIVIVDIQEFPVGFGKNLSIHRKLVQFVERELGDLMVNATLTWHCSLQDIWNEHRNIIVSYDNKDVVSEYPEILFSAVEQKWGNVQTLSDLNQHLTQVADNSISSFYSRPIAAMAELTPQIWGVLTDRYGGLRKMADNVNKHISYWYSGKWGRTANVVAVDFFRSTNIVESAIYWNSKKNYTMLD